MTGIISAYVQKDYYLNKILNEEERLKEQEEGIAPPCKKVAGL